MKLALCLVALVVCAQSVHGLKCRTYAKTGQGDQASPTKECSLAGGAAAAAVEAAAGGCYTVDECSSALMDSVCIRAHMEESGMQVVSALCSNEALYCGMTKAVGGECVACSTDECNSGGMLKPSLAALLLAVLSGLRFLA